MRDATKAARGSCAAPYGQGSFQSHEGRLAGTEHLPATSKPRQVCIGLADSASEEDGQREAVTGSTCRRAAPAALVPGQ